MRHRSAKLLALLLCILLACSVLGGCAQAEPQKYSTSFFDVFDTVTTIIGYADSQETFDRVVGEARQQFVRYHQVFDGYNAYDGVHNLYYVNQNAASGPVPAEPGADDIACLDPRFAALAGGPRQRGHGRGAAPVA